MNETGHANRPVLREIAAKNLLSFGPEGLRLELKPLNVLIGANGSGKSNLFEVLGLLTGCSDRTVAQSESRGRGNSELALASGIQRVHGYRSRPFVDLPDRDEYPVLSYDWISPN